MSLLHGQRPRPRSFHDRTPAPKRLDPRFQRSNVYSVAVCGIPALARVVRFEPATGSIHSCDDDEPVLEYDLYDRKGYRAHWLEEKLERASGTEQADVDLEVGEQLAVDMEVPEP